MESVYWVSGILVSTTPLAGHGKCFSDILSDTNVPKGSDTGGAGDSYMEQTGMLVGNIEFNP